MHTILSGAEIGGWRPHQDGRLRRGEGGGGGGLCEASGCGRGLQRHGGAELHAAATSLQTERKGRGRDKRERQLPTRQEHHCQGGRNFCHCDFELDRGQKKLSNFMMGISQL